MRPNRWWGYVWKAWIVFGVVYEILTLKRGKPLTGVVRTRIVFRLLGSAGMGAFLVWLVWHWLFDPGPGVGTPDLVFVLIGTALGSFGYWVRRRKVERTEVG